MKIIDLIKSDSFRYTGKKDLVTCFKLYLRSAGFRFSLWFRIANYLRGNIVLYFIPWLVLTRLKYKYGYDIPAETNIAPGFYIGHFGGVVVSGKATIGKNCNISQGVTIGYNPRGMNKGYPTIGDNVWIGPGAKIFGQITIGDNVAIAANAVVNCNIAGICTFGGIPARKISDIGAEELIQNKIN
jgi:serine O-acetyltransferase